MSARPEPAFRRRSTERNEHTEQVIDLKRAEEIAESHGKHEMLYAIEKVRANEEDAEESKKVAEFRERVGRELLQKYGDDPEVPRVLEGLKLLVSH